MAIRRQTRERHVRPIASRSHLRRGLLGIALLVVAILAMTYVFTIVVHYWTDAPSSSITR
jgi:hypothetical protein